MFLLIHVRLPYCTRYPQQGTELGNIKSQTMANLISTYGNRTGEMRMSEASDIFNETTMPLIVMTGVPSSGKSTRAKELKEYFENENKEVHVVSEYEYILKAGFNKNLVFQDSTKEKHIRGSLKSEVLKLLRPNNVVILDALNYIKGYRYELYCGSKANRSTQCTILTQINYEEAWNYNASRQNEDEKYDRKTYDAILMRYEEPDKKNRWDSPLFVTFPNYELNMNEISESLFDKKPPPPNLSTQNAPLSSTNFLYELNRIIKEITDAIIKHIKTGVKGNINIPGYDNLELDVTDVTVHKVVLLSRQYITYSKMHTPDIKQVPQLYMQYLRSNLN